MSGDWNPESGGGLSRRRALTLGGAAAVTALSATGFPTSRGTEPASPAQDDPVQELHAQGITGDGVRIGVLDTTGFAADAAFEDAVVGRRSFDGVPVVADGTTHGTAATTTVARTAPDAELLLASFERPAGFRRGLAWFHRTDVDVVLAPVAAYGASVVGRSVVTRTAAAAADAGVTVVAPAGNAARGHWTGTIEPAAGRRRLWLGGADGEGVDGRLLAWAGSPDDDPPELSLALVRTDRRDEGRTLIALSERGEQAGVERLDVTLTPGEYTLEIRLPDRLRDEATGPAVSLSTPTHRLRGGSPRGSIAAPASAPGVCAVGRLLDGRVAAYSGRGPTPDGRRGVDLVARPRRWPGATDPGTSGAAAYVAGVAALVAGVAPGSATDEPTASLRVTASRAGSPGPAAGYGALDAAAAVRHALPDD